MKLGAPLYSVRTFLQTEDELKNTIKTDDAFEQMRLSYEYLKQNIIL